MAAKAFCLITSSIEGKGAYGVRTDTDENVYFPVSVAEGAELEEFEDVEAILVKNDRPEPVWKAIKVRRPSDDA
ncbi:MULTISPECIES: hypothetical protein [Sphingomonas]|uniref:hypothetical protein n=1 Tax=Sphingomonas TaxID=13687 RepID=UPI00083434C8|nr:hypothetical protein [Sphingomonas sp. CCH10-B3]MBA3878696.1 hypothetical protein [Sphingobium sp.]